MSLPAASGGAIPMLPKKGCSGMVMPGEKAAVIFLRSSGMVLEKLLGKSLAEAVFAGSVAGPGDVDVDLLDADFEDVARFGFGDGDGAS